MGEGELLSSIFCLLVCLFCFLLPRMCITARLPLKVKYVPRGAICILLSLVHDMVLTGEQSQGGRQTVEGKVEQRQTVGAMR